MGKFVRGEVVVVPFPFTDLSDVTKRRPALVVANLESDDLILCMITSQATASDKYSLELKSSDFQTGSLDKDSLIRPNRLFTADSKIIVRAAGKLKGDKLTEVTNRLMEIINGSL